MQTVQQVHVRRAGATHDFATDLAAARMVAQLMDAQFSVGSIKVGLDSIIGLVPVVGDLATLGIGLYPIYLAKKWGLGRAVVARMTMNLLIDFGGGLVPIAGDAFDVFYKANLKNLAILESAAKRKGLIG